MKTPPSSIVAPLASRTQRLASATARGFETLNLRPFMKTKTPILKLLIVMCCTVATTVFGQTVYVWTNQNPKQLELSPAPGDGRGSGDLNEGTNWMRVGPIGAGGADPNGEPRPDFQDGVTWGDEMRFDGLTTGPVIATPDGG